ncbi:MAG: hypothetical protein EPO28_17290 [Saprospiraceae bacterium]|nr:MAG: hypothetical protein EPO28_17290 [Saprospiraceae bacterium]
MNRLTLIATFLVFASAAFGQYDADTEPYDSLTAGQRKEMALHAIHAIKNGVLILRLESNHRKIEEMERLAGSTDLNEEEKSKWQTRVAAVKEDTRRRNKWLVDAFAAKYDFSRLLIMYDTATQLLKQDLRSGYFLNQNLELDAAASLGEAPYRLVRFGKASYERSSSANGLVLLDEEFRELLSPFPYFVSLNIFEKMRRQVNESKPEYFEVLVAKLVNRLNRFYGKVIAEGH